MDRKNFVLVLVLVAGLMLPSCVSSSAVESAVRSLVHSLKAEDTTSTIKFDTVSRVLHLAELEGVRELDVRGAFKVELYKSADAPRVELIAPSQERLDLLKVNYNGRKLELRDNYESRRKKHISSLVRLYLPHLPKEVELKLASTLVLKDDFVLSDLEVDLGGASTFVAQGLNVEDLSVELGGASDFEVKQLIAKRAEFDGGGASDITLAGKLERLSLELGGASDFEAQKLIVGHAKIELQGASGATLQVQETLDIEVSGASTLSYKGSPRILKQEVRGQSSVRSW